MAADHFLKDTPVFLGEVNFDKAVTQSIVDQELYLKKHSHTAAGVQIEKTSRALEEFNHMANILQPQISHVI
jgi:hypothetical protein